MPTRPAELIDQPGAQPADVRANLRDQEWINRWLGGVRATLHHLPDEFRTRARPGSDRAASTLRNVSFCISPSPTRRTGPRLLASAASRMRHSLSRARPGSDRAASTPLTVLDAACGGADLSRALVKRCRSRDQAVSVIALDRSAAVLDAARHWSRGYREIEALRGDMVALPFADHQFDVVLASHVIHHLAPSEIPTVLAELARVTRGRLVIADLRRSALAARLFPLLARVARFHPMSRHDGAVSLRNAYTPRELARFARAAGLRGWVIHRGLLRMTLVWDRDAVPAARS